jgi:hypothetical protein
LEVLVSEAAMKYMVGLRRKGLGEGEEFGIDFIVEGYGINGPYGFYGEPVTTKDDLLKMVKLLNRLRGDLSDLVNCIYGYIDRIGGFIIAVLREQLAENMMTKVDKEDTVCCLGPTPCTMEAF